jgi:hypothetical protein
MEPIQVIVYIILQSILVVIFIVYQIIIRAVKLKYDPYPQEIMKRAEAVLSEDVRKYIKRGYAKVCEFCGVKYDQGENYCHLCGTGLKSD